MHIFMTGATGFIGRHLTPHLLAHHHQITVLTRNELRAYQRLGHEIHVVTDLHQLKNLNKYDAVINLAGEPIASGRWTERKKRRICNSRWAITKHLVSLIAHSDTPPQVFLSGSAVGFYGDSKEQVVTEASPAQSDDFAHHVCAKWEQLALQASDHTRVCILRTGLVLGHTGGMFKQLLPLFKTGLGGPLGHGEQYQPWIHIHDIVRAIEFLLDHDRCHGYYNMTAPYPVTNRQLSQKLAHMLHRPCWFAMPAPILKLMLGELSGMLLSGQRALPERLEQDGFIFVYKELDEALSELLSHH